MRNRLLRLCVLFLALVVAACANEPAAPVPAAMVPTATMLPTPTLIPGLPTDPPPPTVGPTLTPTPSPTPSPTPLPATRVVLGEINLAEGNATAAAGHLEAALDRAEELSQAEQIDSLMVLGQAYLAEGRFQEAITTFEQLLETISESAPSAAQFLLAQALAGAGEWETAVAAYENYLAANPEMAAYVQPRIAVAHRALGQPEAAIAAYEAALAGSAHYLTHFRIRQQLVELYRAQEDFPAVIAQYEAMHDLVRTERTQGQMLYQAGNTALQAGDPETAYAYFQRGVNDYPQVYESYLGLVQLVEAGRPVDEFQRGLVDYHAEAYEPAVAAFERYIAAKPDTYRPDAHLYLAWSYAELGNLDAAQAQLDAYGTVNPARALLETAALLARTDQTQAAIDSYLEYVAAYPDSADAPAAAWRAAELTAGMGEIETAVSRYQQFAASYPEHEDAPQALFRAGWLAYRRLEAAEQAFSVWWQAAEAYPAAEYGGAALVWLQRVLTTHTTPTVAPTATAVSPTATITATKAITVATPLKATATVTATQKVTDGQQLLTQVQETALALEVEHYYGLRAADLAADVPPFATAPWQIPDAAKTAEAREESEAWLQAEFDLLPEDSSLPNFDNLSPALTGDVRLIVGEKLWQVGLLEEAKRELEAVRVDAATDPLLSYQLAIHFRDLGLFRSSILAAQSVLNLSGQTVFEAPEFIGRLAYPLYYADLILPLAEEYDYDPLLQFSLVRQESLFESFARSRAAAQGLSQVIPDTGAYIAQRLEWPDYDNEDLYKPYVGLAFGAYYLDLQLDTFDGNVHAALSAYNAGPGNAARWYEAAGADLDLYVETVDFAETRLYIERIYVGHVIYRHLYGR